MVSFPVPALKDSIELAPWPVSDCWVTAAAALFSGWSEDRSTPPLMRSAFDIEQEDSEWLREHLHRTCRAPSPLELPSPSELREYLQEDHSVSEGQRPGDNSERDNSVSDTERPPAVSDASRHVGPPLTSGPPFASGDYSTCDSPTDSSWDGEAESTLGISEEPLGGACRWYSEAELRSSVDSWDGEEAEGPAAKRRRVCWTSAEDMEILTSVRKLGTQWPRIASQLPGRTADAVTPRPPSLAPAWTPRVPAHAPC